MVRNYRYSSLIIGFIIFCDFLGCVVSESETIPLKVQDGWYKEKSKGMLGFFFNEGKYLACDTSEQIEPRNWLRTDFIEFQGAKRVFISINYTIRKCNKNSQHCKEKFELYSTQTTKSASVPIPPNGFDFVAKANPTNIKDGVPDEKNMTSLNATIEAKMDGFYLAFFDKGACITLYSIKIISFFCPEQAGYLELVKFPKVISPASDAMPMQVEGSCSDSNARNTTALLAVCTSYGLWKINRGTRCLCRPGYGYDDNPKRCIACGVQQYKSSLSSTNCKPCPSGSYPFAQKTTCKCNGGLYRLDDKDIDEPCLALPNGPKFANTTTWNSSSILVTWPLLSDKDITFTIKCFICKNNEDKKCVEPCNGNVIFSPSSRVLKGKVSVSGLPAGTKYKFRVYGVKDLNQKVKISEWNYAETYGVTKEDGLCLYKATKTQCGYCSCPPIKKIGTTADKLKDLALTVGVPVLALLVLIIFICGVFLWRRSNRKFGRVPAYDLNDSHELPTIGQKLYIDPTNYDNPEEALKNFAREVDTCSITLLEIIGGGEFGDVYKGMIKRAGEDPLPVAIKTLKKESSRKNRDDFLLEASVMGQFCDPNVVFLEGVVTKSHPLMIVTEFMSNGSLDNFLKEMDSKLSVLQMLGMARGVSSGMKYLSEMNFVHRDLAARNILVSDTLVCKVADFGLSRELEDSAYETKGGKIPVRWTAPEAIKYRKFSTSSDVWSYGILLWEIMSFAERPYWDWSNFEVMDRVETGFRLPPPMQCPTAVHQVMLECWNADRHLRPKFADIVKHLDTLIRSPEKLKENLSIQPSQPNIDYTDGTTIAEWLKSIKMAQYTEKFVQAGYGNLQNLAEFEEPNLEEMGIKLIGHKNKIRKSIQEVRKKLHRESSVPV